MAVVYRTNRSRSKMRWVHLTVTWSRWAPVVPAWKRLAATTRKKCIRKGRHSCRGRWWVKSGLIARIHLYRSLIIVSLYFRIFVLSDQWVYHFISLEICIYQKNILILVIIIFQHISNVKYRFYQLRWKLIKIFNHR